VRWLLGALCFCFACSFDENGAAGNGDGSGGLPEPSSREASVPDGPPGDSTILPDAAVDGSIPDAAAIDAPPPPPNVPHLPPGASGCGTGDLSLGTATIDTTNLTLGITLPAGVTFDSTAQSPGGGPQVAVLHVRGFSITGGTVRVVGSRPLVIVACGDVSIAGTLDAGAAATIAGTGGADSNMGTGAGGAGEHVGQFTDSGGGGAGFATAGGSGGDSSGELMLIARGGAGGRAYGDATQTVLEGGSGGGRGSPGGAGGCPAQPGGAGGGAIQIFSTTRIQVSGGIHAGGGGGAAGVPCGGVSGGGSGGGSGGALFLQAPSITNDGILAANGGGGGGAGSNQTPGQPGLNGGLGNQPAQGGMAGGATGGPGGNGAAGTTPPENAPNHDSQGGANSGGGGGAVGRIRILTQGDNFSDNGTLSPPPDVGTY